jgi:ribonuclease I
MKYLVILLLFISTISLRLKSRDEDDYYHYIAYQTVGQVCDTAAKRQKCNNDGVSNNSKAWVIHGLWPQNNKGEPNIDCKNRDGSKKAHASLSDVERTTILGTYAALRTRWVDTTHEPGVNNSSRYAHELEKHGSCLNYLHIFKHVENREYVPKNSIERKKPYFGKTLELDQKAEVTTFFTQIQQLAEPFTKQQLKNIVNGAPFAVQFVCAQNGEFSLLSDIYIYVAADLVKWKAETEDFSKFKFNPACNDKIKHKVNNAK